MDRLVPSMSMMGAQLHQLVPNVRHERIEGTSHWPHMDRPDEFNRVLDEFLRGIR